MNYSQKFYHKKTQTKNKNKLNPQQLKKVIPKAQKISDLNINANNNKFPSHKIYFQKNQTIPPTIFPKTQLQTKQRYNKQNKRQLNPNQRQNQRIHKSLNFKSSKQKQSLDFMKTIQGFFNKFIKTAQGCTCEQPCKYSQKLFKWVDTKIQIIKPNYQQFYRSWSQQIEQHLKNNTNSQKKPKDTKDSKFNNQDSQKTYFTTRKSQQYIKNYQQILKDVDRTQSSSQTFKNQIFKQKLINILMCYSVADYKLGYIQGMNMILSGILYHVKDQIRTFAVFKKFIPLFRTIYFHNFSQCYQHIMKIKIHLKQQVNDLYQHFQFLGIDLNIVCLPWILSLLTSLVPLQFLHQIYLGFISEKWIFIYRVSLAIFIYLKQKLMTLQDAGQVLSYLSATNQSRLSYDWDDIFKFSQIIPLN